MNGQTALSIARRRRAETYAEWVARTDANYERLEASTHYVYRAFDEHGLLLYIGCTVNPGRRLSAHRSSSAWYEYAADLTLEHFPTRRAGREAETAAIESEGAYFNATAHDIFQTQARRVAQRRYPERTTEELDAKYPVLTDQDRIDRYLAARAEAERRSA